MNIPAFINCKLEQIEGLIVRDGCTYPDLKCDYKSKTISINTWELQKDICCFLPSKESIEMICFKAIQSIIKFCISKGFQVSIS